MIIKIDVLIHHVMIMPVFYQTVPAKLVNLVSTQTETREFALRLDAISEKDLLLKAKIPGANHAMNTPELNKKEKFALPIHVKIMVDNSPKEMVPATSVVAT